MSYEIQELNRRISELVKIGVIAEANESDTLFRVRCGNILTNWIPATAIRAGNDIDYWAPEIGEQVIVLSPAGNLSQGIIIGSLFQSKYPAPAPNKEIRRTVYKDGTIVEYDRAKHIQSTKFCDGTLISYDAGTHQLNIILTTAGKTELISKGGIHVVGKITHEGDLKRTGNEEIKGTLTRTGDENITGKIISTDDQIAGAISTMNHVHGGVMPGGGKTSKPE